MSMAQYGGLLIVSQDEREELTAWAQSRTLPAGDVFRARLILALAKGCSYHEIAGKAGYQFSHHRPLAWPL
jgi:hypothetical protein